jgi:hypothetical protein
MFTSGRDHYEKPILENDIIRYGNGYDCELLYLPNAYNKRIGGNFRLGYVHG